MAATPDISGFRDAMSRFNDRFARTVVFMPPEGVNFAPGVATDPETGQPYDPLTTGSAVPASASAVPAIYVRSGFLNTPDEVATAIGRIETGQAALIIDADDWTSALGDAGSVEVLGEVYSIVRTDEDGIADGPPHRYIVVIEQL